MKLDFSDPALDDIEHIHETIFRDRPMAAARISIRLRDAAKILRDHPEAGRLGAFEGTREWLVRGLPYILVYRFELETETVTIVRVFHTAQQRGSPARED